MRAPVLQDGSVLQLFVQEHEITPALCLVAIQ